MKNDELSRVSMKTMPGNLLDRLTALEGQVAKLERALSVSPVEAASSSGMVEETFVLTGIADNVATGVFRVETTETSVSDQGEYVVFVEALVGHGISTPSNTAVRGWAGVFARAMKGSGTNGVNSAVSEVVETASAATASGTRDIANITVTAVENSEFQVDVKFQIDLSGSGVLTGEVVCFVRLLWYGFAFEPVLSQL